MENPKPLTSIEKKSEKIAKYMGWTTRLHDVNCNGHHVYRNREHGMDYAPSDFKYYTSWNWIMRVWLKLRSSSEYAEFRNTHFDKAAKEALIEGDLPLFFLFVAEMVDIVLALEAAASLKNS